MRVLSFVTSLSLSAMMFAALADEALSAKEKSEGWRSLLDGKSTDGWRSYASPQFPAKGWVLEDGVLKHVAKGGGGDIITKETFEEFDLVFEWKVAKGANSGLKYFVLPSRGPVGHEYQLIDDETHADAKVGPKRATGSFYDVLPPGKKSLKPPGEWNVSRIKIQGNKAEHWLNGEKILAYDLGGEETAKAVAQSKFKTTPNFGSRVKGHILLQDHGDEISFRNIKIRPL